MAEFFHMGGFAFYVWTSYGLTLLLVVLEIRMLKNQRVKLNKRVKRMLDFQRKQAGDNS